MELFDFITDEDLRAGLIADYDEIQACFEAKAWKSVHILAGSIVEAVLTDHLIADGMNSEEVLKFHLDTLIKYCRDKKIISSKASDLSVVIKEFRNLIHPGRALRLKETVNNDTAEIVKALFKIIVEEVSKKKRENYGYTAEQIVAKLEKDSSAKAIIHPLLKGIKSIEIERLLLNILPDKYMLHYRMQREIEQVPSYILPSFEACFRIAFELAEKKLKAKVAARFVTIFKEEDEEIVCTYGTAFLRCSDLLHVPGKDADLVKINLLSRLQKSHDAALLSALEGIGRFLLPGDTTTLIDPLMKIFIHNKISDEYIETLVQSIYVDCSMQLQEAIEKRLGEWITHNSQNVFLSKKIEKLKNNLLPF